MVMSRLFIHFLIASFGLLLGLPAIGQTQQAQPSVPPPAAQAPAAAPAAAPTTYSPELVRQKLGVYVYPAKNQTMEKQSADEKQCFTWAQQQTGINPMAPPPPPSSTATAEQPPQSSSEAGKGTVAKSTAKGAVAGTAIGAIAGGTGTGAAIGATTGVIGGVARKKKEKKEAQAQQQQAQQQAQTQAQAQEQQRLDTFKKAYSACLQGRGYTVN